MRSVTFIFLSLFSLMGFPQNTDSSRVESLGAESLKLVYSKPYESRARINEALKLSNTLGDDGLKAKIYNYLGIYFDVIGDLDSSFWAYDQAVNLAKAAGSTKTLAGAYNNIGLLHWNRIELEKAATYFFKAASMYEQLGNQKGLANTYSNIGLIFEEQKRAEEGIRYSRKALEIRLALNDSTNIGKSYSNLGLLMSVGENYDSSTYFFRKALPYFIASNNLYDLGTCYQNLGMNAHVFKRFDDGISYAKKAIETREKIGNPKLIAASYNLLGHLYYSAKRYSLSEPAFLKALATYEELNIEKEMYLLYHRLAKLYNDWGKYEKAADYMFKRASVSDTLYQRENRQKLYDIEVKYETEKKEKELAEIKYEKEKAAREIAQDEVIIAGQNRQKQMLFFGLVIAILIAVVLVVFYRNRIQTARQERQQELLNQKLEISRELHDNIGSQLTYLNLNLDVAGKLEGDRLTGKLNEIQSFAKNTLTDLRGAIWGLSKDVTSTDLAAKIADELQKVQTSGIETVYDSDGVTDRVLPSKIAVNVLRIAQEAIQNAVKHSGGDKVQVVLDCTPHTLSLEVRDNGTGMNKAGSGFGLEFMKQRAKRIGGQLNWDSQASGTRVTLTLDRKE